MADQDLDDEILALIDPEEGQDEQQQPQKQSQQQSQAGQQGQQYASGGRQGSQHAGQQAKSSSSSRKRRSGDSDLDDDSDNRVDEDGELSDPEWAEADSWDRTDLMGDKEDRRRLMAMSELDRELLLAERQKKVDALQERMILKSRINRQTGLKRAKQDAGEGSSVRLSERERKGKSFESLRRKRENREKERRTRSYSDEDEEDEDDIDADADQADDRWRKNRYESDVSSRDSDDDVKERTSEAKVVLGHEHITSIQITREELEKWAHASFFASTVKGCFVRLGVGSDPATREQVYRATYVVEATQYHRAYQFGGAKTNTALVLAHGRAQKPFLMDIISNRPITEAEWRRYEQTMQIEKQVMPSLDHIKRKQADLKKAREHIFSNDEINEMIKRKQAFSNVPVNLPAERLRLRLEIDKANERGDRKRASELQSRLDELGTLVDQKQSAASSEDKFAKINERNRKSNFIEGREAERSVIEQKKTKGAVEYDPFARRRTAPIHVINGITEEPDAKPKQDDKGASASPTPMRVAKPLQGGILSGTRSSLSGGLPKTPSSRSAAVADVLDDDFLDSLDVDAIAAELRQ
ncbi:hypothetical protein BC831DRAFT_442351 [Entophlyctis helioformis]|nr:hypothetical protein BC831DRAFT_442351 [Entophlyctis helioformis]